MDVQEGKVYNLGGTLYRIALAWRKREFHKDGPCYDVKVSQWHDGDWRFMYSKAYVAYPREKASEGDARTYGAAKSDLMEVLGVSYEGDPTIWDRICEES